MRERSRNVMVGLCTIGGLAGLTALLFFFGELEPIFTRRWPLHVAFNEAGGLRKGSLVTLNGVPIGAIEDVVIWDDPEKPVLMTAGINERVRIPDPSKPSVQASLLGSGARLEFTAALPIAKPMRSYAIDGKVILRGVVEPLESRVIDRVSEKLDPLIANFREIGTLARNLNELVKPLEGDARTDAENVRTVIRKLYETLESANVSLVSARSWFDDEQLRSDVRNAAHGANELMRDGAIMTQRITVLADSLAADAAALRAGALPVFDRTSAALQELERLLTSARTGDGTIGRLMKDPALYEDFSDAAKRLEDALAKLSLLLEKIRGEGLNFELTP